MAGADLDASELAIGRAVPARTRRPFYLRPRRWRATQSRADELAHQMIFGLPKGVLRGLASWLAGGAGAQVTLLATVRRTHYRATPRLAAWDGRRRCR